MSLQECGGWIGEKAVGRLATAQASLDPEPSWEGWADMRKSISLNCTDTGERLAWASWDAYFEGEIGTPNRELERRSWCLVLAEH